MVRKSAQRQSVVSVANVTTPVQTPQPQGRSRLQSNSLATQRWRARHPLAEDNLSKITALPPSANKFDISTTVRASFRSPAFRVQAPPQNPAADQSFHKV